MAGYTGSVGLTGYVAPKDTLDTYAIQDETFNRGGYRTVADLTERDDITTDRRKLGMLVYVLSEDKYYTLKTGLTNSDWVLASLGGSSEPLFVDIISDTNISLPGYYFMYDGAELTITSNATNRVFNIKAVENCKVTVDTNIIEGVSQSISLNEGSGMTVLAKDDDTYWILNKY